MRIRHGLVLGSGVLAIGLCVLCAGCDKKDAGGAAASKNGGGIRDDIPHPVLLCLVIPNVVEYVPVFSLVKDGPGKQISPLARTNRDLVICKEDVVLRVHALPLPRSVSRIR